MKYWTGRKIRRSRFYEKGRVGFDSTLPTNESASQRARHTSCESILAFVAAGRTMVIYGMSTHGLNYAESTKRFDAVVALKQCFLKCKGLVKVHALLGSNGSGKSHDDARFLPVWSTRMAGGDSDRWESPVEIRNGYDHASWGTRQLSQESKPHTDHGVFGDNILGQMSRKNARGTRRIKGPARDHSRLLERFQIDCDPDD